MSFRQHSQTFYIGQMQLQLWRKKLWMFEGMLAPPFDQAIKHLIIVCLLLSGAVMMMVLSQEPQQHILQTPEDEASQALPPPPPSAAHRPRGLRLWRQPPLAQPSIAGPYTVAEAKAPAEGSGSFHNRRKKPKMKKRRDRVKTQV